MSASRRPNTHDTYRGSRYIFVDDANEYTEYMNKYSLVQCIDGIRYKSNKGKGCNLENLDDKISYIWISEKEFVNIDKFPTSLKYLIANNNNIATIPNLPDSLLECDLRKNNLKEIAYFPNRLCHCDFSRNQLYEIPEFPKTLMSGTFFMNFIKYISCENTEHIKSLYNIPPHRFDFYENPVIAGYKNIYHLLDLIQE
jgi:hypothetical protein